MNIHEHQAKELLATFGVAVTSGKAVFTPDEAVQAFEELAVPLVVVKSQIHAGGRGKGKLFAPLDRSQPILEGGVKLARSATEVRDLASKMLGNVLVTKQTGPSGRLVRRLYIQTAAEIARELYVSIAIDRAAGLPLLLASAEGGVEIEEVAARSPEKILKVHFDPREGLWPHQARELAYFLGLKGDTFKSGVTFFTNLARAFCALDCSLAEINPLAVTKEGRLLALDAKLSLDDNALHRHKELEALRDPTEEDPNETEAKKFDLSYIALDGDIGCMVNGAGLAMATMDAIKLYGRQPANFLDVGGGASREKVAAAFKIILHDPKVKAILVNIFGGIMQCDVIAEGILAAVRQTHLAVPLVVRLEGTNVERGKRKLAESGLPILSAGTLAEAAQRVTQAA